MNGIEKLHLKAFGFKVPANKKKLFYQNHSFRIGFSRNNCFSTCSKDFSGSYQLSINKIIVHSELAVKNQNIIKDFKIYKKNLMEYSSKSYKDFFNCILDGVQKKIICKNIF